jgi:hypothetical protein
MALQNRVLPTGEIVADPARGMFTGNRGCLHDGDQRLRRARWKGKAWICCLLQFKGWQRRVMTPGRWTELFFLDEAVAMAAGHRPCALCRRADYDAFRTAWAGAGAGLVSAVQMDRVLHDARIAPDRGQRRFEAASEALPDGCFILWQGRAHLIWGKQAFDFAPAGYRAALPRPAGRVVVLTPAPMVAVLTAGYRPKVGLAEGANCRPDDQDVSVSTGWR